MDPRQSKPNSRPPVRRAPSETDATHDTRVRPYRAPGDPVLEPPEQPDEIGRLGHYRVLDELGRGGMGVVYRAEDVHLQRQVALKVMFPDAASDPRARVRFQREARAQAKVEHDHVAVIYQVDEVGGVPFIAMPLLKGQTLAAALKQNPRPPVAELVRIGREIAEGLAAAHAAGLIHRDIKPANIWLEGAKRRVKILDFGLAREQAKPTASDEAEPLTDRGVVLGTPSYMSPEQAHGRTLDPRTDLWSLGAVLYEMATGRKPFTGPSPFAVLVAASQQELTPPTAVVPELPPALSDFICKLLSKRPADRPQTAEAAAEALAAIERGLVVLPVQVFPLSSAVGAPAGPDPWADIDATQTDEVAAAPERAAVRPRARAPKWLWPVVALLGLVAAGALVSWAVPWWKAKKPEPPDETKAPLPKPPGDNKPPADDKKKPADPERRAAEWVVANRGFVALWSRNQYLGAYPTDGDLPKTPFRVTGIELKSPGALDEKALDGFRELTGLIEFTLDGPTVSDAALARFLDSPGAEKLLALRIHTDVSNDALKSLPKLRQLSIVNLRSTKLTDAGVEYLRGLPLTRVDLSKSGVRGLAALAGKGLTHLSLDTCESVDDKALEHLKGTTTLQDVNLARTNVGNAGLAHLSGNTGLVSLDLSESKVDRDGLDHVVRFSKLYSLFLDLKDISDADLPRLKALPELRHLTLRKTAVTNAGLKELAALKLTTLELQHLPITDEGLENLAGATTLERLFLGNTKVGEAGAKKLAAALPKCTIRYGDGKVIEPTKKP